MELSVEKKTLDKLKADCVILGHFEDKGALPNYKNLDNNLSKILQKENFKGEFKTTKVLRTFDPASYKVILIGLGKNKDFDLEKLRRVSGYATKHARDDDCKIIATTLHNVDVSGKSTKEKSQAVTEGSLLSLYSFDSYKTVDVDKIKKVNKIILICDKDEKAVQTGAKIGKVLVDAANYTRDLGNTPAKIATPTYLANEAKKLGKKHGLKVTVLGKAEMKKLGMNAILGVSAGSGQEPKFVTMVKKGKGAPVALVGKGITFDSGGLNLKTPFQYMLEMKFDMCGAATVLGTMKAACELKLPIHLVGVFPATENMTGENAQKPGDIVKAYNGKTIEILNTDAEGRLVLADALSYAEDKFKPKAIVDLATLTGAVIVALGYSAAGMFSNNDALVKKMQKSAENTGERVWHMPLYQDYKDLVKSDNADVVNIGLGPTGREAGSGTAAALLEKFVKGPWVHLDIAGTASRPDETDYTQIGATGYGVRLLIDFLQS